MVSKNSVNYHCCPYSLSITTIVFQGYILSYFYKLLRALGLKLQNPCYDVHILRKCIESKHFYPCHLPFPLSQNSPPTSYHHLPHCRHRGIAHFHQAAIFWRSISPNSRKGWNRPWFALSKFRQKIWGWPGKLRYLYFLWLVIFSNELALQFCK